MPKEDAPKALKLTAEASAKTNVSTHLRLNTSWPLAKNRVAKHDSREPYFPYLSCTSSNRSNANSDNVKAKQ